MSRPSTRMSSASLHVAQRFRRANRRSATVNTPKSLHRRRDLRESRPAAQHFRALQLPTPPLGLTGALDGGTGTQNPAVEVFGPVGQSRRLVDRIADNRVFVAVFRADVACE